MNKMNVVPKEKAIKLIDGKINLFEEIKSNARYSYDYDNRYQEDYDLAYHGSETLLETLFGKEIRKSFVESVSGLGIAFLGGDINYSYELEDYKRHLSKCISQLKIYKDNIINFWDDDIKRIGSESFQISNKVFIVHGHNEEIKQSVARIVEKQKIESIILHEKPNKGNTIIEKIERNSDVGAAIILFTGDDYGYEKNKDISTAKLRPRQNVIFEMGLFVGKLGRERVICLFEENLDIEILSDFAGIVYIPYDSKGKWKYDLGKELSDIGFNFDLNII